VPDKETLHVTETRELMMEPPVRRLFELPAELSDLFVEAIRAAFPEETTTDATDTLTLLRTSGIIRSAVHEATMIALDHVHARINQRPMDT
jgi:hypothetical protein